MYCESSKIILYSKCMNPYIHPNILPISQGNNMYLRYYRWTQRCIIKLLSPNFWAKNKQKVYYLIIFGIQHQCIFSVPAFHIFWLYLFYSTRTKDDSSASEDDDNINDTQMALQYVLSQYTCYFDFLLFYFH